MADDRKIALDGLRGYAALVVVMFHSILGLDSTQIQRVLAGQWSELSSSESLTKLSLKIFDGEKAVMLFFVLSGAVLFRSLMNEREKLSIVAVKFYVRRFFRIYPALFVCLVACALALAVRKGSFPLSDFIENALLFDFKINGASWTLNAEMIAPAFLLLCYAAFRVAREWGLIIAIALISGVLALPVLDGYLFYFKYSWFCFALGALIPTRVGQAVAMKLPRWSWIVALAGLMLFRWPIRELSLMVLVMTIYYHRADAIEPFLSNRVSQFLGRISFSLYLFNVLFLEWICELLRQYPWAVSHTVLAGAGVALVVVIFTIPVAHLSWSYIEMPLNRFGHRLTGRASARLVANG